MPQLLRPVEIPLEMLSMLPPLLPLSPPPPLVDRVGGNAEIGVVSRAWGWGS